jgi:hypothetical protein
LATSVIHRKMEPCNWPQAVIHRKMLRCWGRRGRDRMLVTTNVVDSNIAHGEVYIAFYCQKQL